MSIPRRRPVRCTSKHSACKASTQPSITGYTRVTKPTGTRSKTEEIEAKLHSTCRSPSREDEVQRPPKRRRVGSSPTDTQTPRTEEVDTTSLSSLSETPVKKCRTVFNEQGLATPETTPRKPSSEVDSSEYSPCVARTRHVTSKSIPFPRVSVAASEHREERRNSEDLPEELFDLIDINTAFWKASSLQFAHHGTTTPIPIENILSTTSQAWGQRKVTLVEIRKILRMQDGTCIALYEYGAGRICLERVEETGHRPWAIDEKALNMQFRRRLESAWEKWQTEQEGQGASVKDFEAQLPLLEIQRTASLDKVKPLFAEGQRRLKDIKSAASDAQAQAITTATSPSIPKTATGVKARQSSLLERLKAKQREKQDAPATPTDSQLARKAALQRLAAIVPVLSVRRPGASDRQTLTLQALVERVRDSSRSPLSSREIEDCVRLLAEEIAPGFVVLYDSGSVNGVIVNHALKPADLDARIREATVHVRGAACSRGARE